MNKISLILNTAIGLQDVDHLKTSSFFNEKAKHFLKDKISFDDFKKAINDFSNNNDENTYYEEADKVSIRIAELLLSNEFEFSIDYYLKIHSFLFKGLVKHPGSIRKYNFIKNEKVLKLDSVSYADFREIRDLLLFDFKEEKLFDYSGLSIGEKINHLAVFIGNLWQIHIFEEGNTRTTAVFLIKYLEYLGFDFKYDAFVHHSHYFRDALVRANYSSIINEVEENKNFLILFLHNLILGEQNKLESSDLII